VQNNTPPTLPLQDKNEEKPISKVEPENKITPPF